MPVRPNPIGMSVVELVDFSTQDGQITVKGLDALDGTPVLDIKPYIPNFDSYPDARVPKWVSEHLNSHFHAGHNH
jgi:tRNA (Thr-GGU) A37 N-methylase